MFGLSGAHRSGKTTTARETAKAMGILFHETSTTKIMREGGFEAVADMPIEQRIAAQEYLLSRHIEDLQNLPRPCIVDRTPLDMIGYMLGEVTMNNTPVELGERVDRYVTHCLKIADLYYDTIVMLRPLGTYEADPTKPPPNSAYQWEHQFLVEGSAKFLRHVAVGHCASEDLEVRVRACMNLFNKRLDHHKQTMESFPVS